MLNVNSNRHQNRDNKDLTKIESVNLIVSSKNLSLNIKKHLTADSVCW